MARSPLSSSVSSKTSSPFDFLCLLLVGSSDLQNTQVASVFCGLPALDCQCAFLPPLSIGNRAPASACAPVGRGENREWALRGGLNTQCLRSGEIGLIRGF